MAGKRKRQCFFILVIIAALVVAGVIFRTRPGSGEIRNVVLISIDTCRADHLGCYGYPGKPTLTIDLIAA